MPRRHRLTGADLDGYQLLPLPDQLPERLAGPPPVITYVRAIFEAIYSIDSDFKERGKSVNNATAQTGSYQADKSLMAAAIYAKALQDDIRPILALGPKAIGKIKKKWLPKMFEERGLGRQARISTAIQEGRRLAAEQREAEATDAGE